MLDFAAAARNILDDVVAHEPVAATFLGVHSYDGEFPDMSSGGFAERRRRAESHLKTLRSYDPAELSPDDRIDWDLMRASFAVGVREHDELQAFARNPSLYSDTAINGIYGLFMRDFAPLTERLPSVQRRLEKVPELLRAGRMNLTHPPVIWLDNAAEETEGAIEFLRATVGPHASDRPQLNRALDGAMEGLREYGDYLKWKRGTADGITFAAGASLFDYKLRHEHFLPYDSESLLAFGEAAVRSTRQALDEAARSMDPSKAWPELIDAFREDHPSAPALLDEYRRSLDAAKQFVLDRGLVTIPAGERLRIVETPAFMRPTLPYAAYQSPGAFDEEQDGIYYVTPVDGTASEAIRAEQLRGHNRFGMLLTNVHEGYPGHHLQLVRANQSASAVRRIFRDSSVFCEGWALYCEQLVLDEGLSDDPRMRLFQLKDQLWRACRVVVDVKLHTLGMTFDEAVDYLVDVARLERSNAIGEVRRYTLSPTQPMSYLVGKQQIVELRGRERVRLGSRFDLRAFHDRLLSFGTVPIALIEPNL